MNFLAIIKFFITFLSFHAITTAYEEISGIDPSDPTHRNQLPNKVEEIRGGYLNKRNPSSDDNVHLLTNGIEKLLVPKNGNNRLEIFCYAGEPRSFATLLKTVELVVKVPKDNFHYYEGRNSSSVKSQYADASWFSFSAWRPSSFRLNIYNHSCIGIETSESFRVTLKIRYVDLWRVVTLAVGIGLFIMAPLLAHNVVFHYVTGVSVGVFGSLLVIVFFVSRLIPKKTGAFAVLLGGWGLVLYTLQYLWNNCLVLLKEYQTVVAGYVGLAGIISFAVVYRLGPIEDTRSLRLVQWALQLAGLSAIFISSQYKEFTLAVVIILLTYYNIPSSWKFRIRTYWLRHFPPKPKLLTEEEYLEQARVETKSALDELRGFCHSPDCNAWKTMSKLKTPQRYSERIAIQKSQKMNEIAHRRFAEFVEGGSHLSDEEIMSYESANYYSRRSGITEQELITTDEDSEEERR